MIVDTATPTEDRQVAAASLRTFMRLPPVQRSSVILADVLGYSLEEIGGILEVSIPAVKAALHRGRTRLRKLSEEEERAAPARMLKAERERLAAYIERFNARDFDAIRDMLADDVRLEVVNSSRKKGRTEVGTYFHNYSRLQDWRFVPGFVEGRPAAILEDSTDTPIAFVLLEWNNNKIVGIRDFVHAGYALEGAEVVVADWASRSQ